MSPAAEPFACALAIVVAMSAAGVAHTVWMRSPASALFRIPLDGGRRWRGRRLFGDHKTVRGFMVMVPAAGVAFACLGLARGIAPAWPADALWGMTPAGLFWLGAWAGLAFMAGELPNSFYKRRRGIAPGAVPATGAQRWLCLLLDRIDSTVALLLALSVAVPLDWRTWIWVLALGPAIHWAFSAALFLSGVKARVA